METAVQLYQLVIVALFLMKFGEENHFLHLVQLLSRDPLAGHPGAEPFQPGTHLVDDLHILGRDAVDVSALVRHNRHQSFKLQLS